MNSYISFGAPIVSLKDFSKIRKTLGGKTIVATGGGYDPIHPGHIACIHEAKKLGDILVVVVNGDNFLEQKKGMAFMNLFIRASIISALADVDYVIPYETDKEMGVRGAIDIIEPNIYAKGGDRSNPDSIRDFDYYLEKGIRVVSGVGGTHKIESSSNVLDIWFEKKQKLAKIFSKNSKNLEIKKEAR